MGWGLGRRLVGGMSWVKLGRLRLGSGPQPHAGPPSSWANALTSLGLPFSPNEAAVQAKEVEQVKSEVADWPKNKFLRFCCFLRGGGVVVFSLSVCLCVSLPLLVYEVFF